MIKLNFDPQQRSLVAMTAVSWTRGARRWGQWENAVTDHVDGHIYVRIDTIGWNEQSRVLSVLRELEPPK